MQPAEARRVHEEVLTALPGYRFTGTQPVIGSCIVCGRNVQRGHGMKLSGGAFHHRCIPQKRRPVSLD